MLVVVRMKLLLYVMLTVNLLPPVETDIFLFVGVSSQIAAGDHVILMLSVVVDKIHKRRYD